MYQTILNLQDEPPGQWAQAREAEGWDGLAVGDHWYVEGVGGFAHPFVSLGVMAAQTTGVGLFTTFANNLARSPVEFAQAALTVQQASDGRFQAGLGAGWQAKELIGAGLAFPAPRERARRLREAVLLVRQIFEGPCSFHGEYYTVDLPAVGPRVVEPPPLCAALGGEWTIRHVGPLVDSIELATMGAAFRGGTADFARYCSMDVDQLRGMIVAARDANPTAPLGLALFVAAGQGPVIDFAADAFKGGTFEGLAGEPAQVADALRRFGDLGVDRLTLGPMTATTPAQLAPHLYA